MTSYQKRKARTANSSFGKSGSKRLRLNFSAKDPPHRQAANRYLQAM